MKLPGNMEKVTILVDGFSCEFTIDIQEMRRRVAIENGMDDGLAGKYVTLLLDQQAKATKAMLQLTGEMWQLAKQEGLPPERFVGDIMTAMAKSSLSRMKTITDMTGIIGVEDEVWHQAMQESSMTVFS